MSLMDEFETEHVRSQRGSERGSKVRAFVDLLDDERAEAFEAACKSPRYSTGSICRVIKRWARDLEIDESAVPQYAALRSWRETPR